MPIEHRTAANDRHLAETALERLGWTRVALSRDKQLTIPAQFIKMMQWCDDNVGTGRVEIEQDRIDDLDMWYSFSWYGYWNFWFRHKRDAVLFTLRWA